MCLLLLFTFLLLFHFDILLSTWLLLIFCLFHLSFSLLCNDWTLAAVSSRECRFVDSPHFSVEERRSKLTFWVLLNFNENWLFFFALLKQILLGKFLHGFVKIRKLCYFFFCFNFFLLGSLYFAASRFDCLFILCVDSLVPISMFVFWVCFSFLLVALTFRALDIINLIWDSV